MTMMRGAHSVAEGRLRSRRGGLTTLARYGGEAMAETARAGFRRRFEHQALQQAQEQGRTLTETQLAESADALLRAHMLLMVEKRLEKRREQHGRDWDSQESERPEKRAAVAPAPPAPQPLRLCIGCWLEVCPGEPFPEIAIAILCPTHLAAYTAAATEAAASR